MPKKKRVEPGWGLLIQEYYEAGADPRASGPQVLCVFASCCPSLGPSLSFYTREAPPNSTVPLTSQRHPEKLHEVTGTELAGSLGTPLGIAQRKRASSRGEAGTSGFLSVSDSDCTVPAVLGQESHASSCLRKGTPLASRVAQGVSGPSASCVWNPRVFADDARGWQCPFDKWLVSVLLKGCVFSWWHFSNFFPT